MGISVYSTTDGFPFFLQNTPTFSCGFDFTTDYVSTSIFIHFLNRVNINVNDVVMKMMPATVNPTTGIKYNSTAATYSLPSGSSFNTSYTFSIDLSPSTYQIYQIDFIYQRKMNQIYLSNCMILFLCL